MFDGDLTTLSTTDLLASAADHRAEANRADARLLVHAQIYADRFHPDVCPVRPGRTARGGRERAVVLGGEGCPEIAEFAVTEFGVMLGISPGVAADYLGQALALRHRFPFTWARVLAGEATPWRARLLTTACLKLSEQAAHQVDQRVAPILDTITPYRLDKIIKAAKIHADPERARAEAEEKARERGVYVGHSDEHGTKTIYIRAATGDVIRFDATIASIADALKILGDTTNLRSRRAKAIGIIADPRYTEELLLQAREHHLHHTPPQPAKPDPTTPQPGPNTPPSHDTPGSTTPATAPTSGTTSRDKAPDSTAPVGAPASRTSSSDDDLLNDWTSPWHEPAPEDQVDRDAPPPSASDDTRPADACHDEDDLLTDWTSHQGEPGPEDEADRDAPHPSASDLPDPLDAPYPAPVEPFDANPHINTNGAEPDGGEPIDAAAQRTLDARLANIKHQAHTNPTSWNGADRPGRRLRPGKTEIYVHLTDHTLATGTGVLRAESIGPLLATQLTDLIGHSPYTVKPVIDLNNAISVDAYEIPHRIREHVKLTHPVELFPYGTRETHHTMDIDHIHPYDPLGPPGQTNTHNLAPLGRFTHRVKTHAPGWTVHRLDPTTLQWTTPHGFTFHVTPTGTHRVQTPRKPPNCPT